MGNGWMSGARLRCYRATVVMIWSSFFLFFALLSLGIEDSYGIQERRDLTRQSEEREKIIIKYKTTVTVQIYRITVAFLHR